MDTGETVIPGMHGRASELGRIERGIAATGKRCFLIHGEPGIGKTHILRWLRDRVARDDYLVSVIRVPSAARIPVRSLARSLVEQLIRTARARASEDPIAQDAGSALNSWQEYGEGSLVVSLVRALDSVGSRARLAILIDDFHALPRDDAMELVNAVRASEADILLIACSRNPHESELVGSADLWVDRVALAPLDQEALLSIAREHLGFDVLPSLGASLRELSGGNPLFAMEMLRTWQRDHALKKFGSYWGFAEDHESQHASLSELIGARIQHLNRSEMLVAEVLALLDREATFAELMQLVELRPEILEGAIEGLLEAGVAATASATQLKFSLAHPLVANAIVSSMSPTRAGRLHGRLFQVLSDYRETGHGMGISEIAHHGCASLETPRELPNVLTEAAASAQQAGDHRDAARWYKELIERGDLSQEQSAEIHERVGLCLLHFAPDEAARHFTTALSGFASPNRRAAILIGRAQARRRTGDFDAALADLTAALPGATPDFEFDIRHGIAIIHAISGRKRQAETQLRSLARDAKGTPSEIKAIGHLAHVRYCDGAVREGEQLARYAFAHCTDDDYRQFLLTNLGWYHVLLGEWAMAEEEIGLAIAESDHRGDIWNLAAVLCSKAKLRALQGRIPEALDAAARSLRLAPQIGNPTGLIDAAGALAWAHLENDQPRAAVAALGSPEDLISNNREPREIAFTLGLLAEASIKVGDHDNARRAIALSKNHLEASAFCAQSIDRLEAQLEFALGNPANAAGKLERWIESPGDVVFERASTHEAAASISAKLARRKQAIEHIDSAIDIYERLGAAKRLERAKMWRADNYRRPPGRPRSTLPAGITARERDVLELVILGKTNREIAQALVLSVLTVNKHVENIMMKARVARRTELVAFAERHGFRHPIEA